MSDEAASNRHSEFPVEIMQRQYQPVYIYRLPGNECYKFTPGDSTNRSVKCIACISIYNRKRRSKEDTRSPHRRRIEMDCAMESDPTEGHLDECVPFDYVETIRIYQPVVDQNDSAVNCSLFPLERTMKADSFLIVHRLDSSKCRRFSFNGHRGSHLVAVCSSCFVLKRKMKVLLPRYEFTEYGFLDDPRLHHLPGCTPVDYEENSLQYKAFDEENGRQIIRSWARELRKKDVEDSSKNSSSRTKSGSSAHEMSRELSKKVVEDSCKNSYNPTKSGVHVVAKEKDVRFLYRVPGSDKCHCFIAKANLTTSVTMICAQCDQLKPQQYKGKRKVSERVTDGHSMQCDPLLNHNEYCQPQSYSEIMKDSTSVVEVRRPREQYEFPLVKIHRSGTIQVVYQREDDPTKCYLFYCEQKTKTSWITVGCSNCLRLATNKREGEKDEMQPIKTDYKRHRINKSGFLDDPLGGHLPNCDPLSFEDVMQKRHLVDEETAEKFLSGTYDRFINAQAQLFAKSDFPVHVIQKRNSTVFVYTHRKNPSYVYVFNQLNHADNTQLVCQTCVRNNTADEKAVVRQADGCSMEKDPMKGHLALCKGRKNSLVWIGSTYIRVDGTLNPHRKYEYSLEKKRMREIFTTIYILSKEPSKCYRFFSLRCATRTGTLTVKCHSCRAIVAAEKRAQSTNLKVFSYRCTVEGFLDDPTKKHVNGCEPVEHAELMKQYVKLEGKDADDYFKNMNTSTQTYGLDPSSRRMKITLKEKHIGEESGFQAVQIEDTEIGRASDVQPDVVQLVSKRTESNEKTELPNKGNAAEIKMECDDFEENPDMKVEDDSKYPFRRVFEVPFFEKKELTMLVKDRTVILEFRREVSEAGVESCFLRYSLEFPLSVDMSTVQTTWNHDCLTLTAGRMKGNSDLQD